jgi:GT2 family glycosyltransferase
LHEKIGGFDETLIRGGEDEDYCWRVQLETDTPLVFVPDAVIHYRYRTRLREMYRQARNGGASKVYLYAKWRDRMTVPEHQWSAAFWAWLRVLAQLSVVRDKGSLGLWIRWVGKLVGHAEASVQLRVLLLCSYPDLAAPPNFRSGAKRVASRSESVNLPW